MQNKAPYLALFAIFGLSGCGSDYNAGMPPPANAPVVNPPPAEQPFGEDPSNETPPSEEPPLEEPPAGQPPVADPVEMPAEEPDSEEPVAALKLDPEIAAKGVAPNGSIVLISDRPLDATSAITSLELRDASTTDRLPASVTYNAETRSVTITPSKTLGEGKHYAVHANGTRDIDGNSVGISGQAVARVKQRIYSRVTVYNEDGTPGFASHFSKTGVNEATKIYYDGPGEDGVWFEGEDDVSHYEITHYLPGNVQTVFTYYGPGADGAWFDDNDQFERAWRYRHTDDGRITERLQTENAGLDGNFFTGDDHYRVAEFRVHDENSRLALSLYRSVSYPEEMRLNPGSDGKWLTGDDGGFLYERYEYDEAGRLVRRVTYSSASGNSDNVAFNEDDRITGYSDFFYDQEGRLFESHRYYDPGTNGTWFNNDDRASAVYRTIRPGPVLLEEYRDAGTDGRPNTGDDRLMSYFYKAYDDLGRLVRGGTYNGRGRDQDWHTADDVPFSGATIYRHGVDEHGQPQMKMIGLADNGEDELRFSGDEEITSVFLRSYDESSQLTRTRFYLEPGMLPGWEDGDEILYAETEYLDTEE